MEYMLIATIYLHPMGSFPIMQRFATLEECEYAYKYLGKNVEFTSDKFRNYDIPVCMQVKQLNKDKK